MARGCMLSLHILNDHKLIKFEHPNDFQTRNSDDLHVKIFATRIRNNEKASQLS